MARQQPLNQAMAKNSVMVTQNYRYLTPLHSYSTYSMRVLNSMLGKGSGGIEMAFRYYAEALLHEKMEVICCTAAGADINAQLPNEATKIELKQTSEKDVMAIWKAAKILRQRQPDIIITHGRRAFRIFTLARHLTRAKPPVVNVLHRPRFKKLRSAQHIITVSNTLRHEVIQHGIPPQQVTHIPNFLPSKSAADVRRPWQTPVVIGLLTRLVPVKGADLLIEALALLKTRGVMPQVHIAGDGAELNALRQQAKSAGVAAQITWLGWVNDTDSFFNRIDLFCLPSRAESFGLVVLEAFAHSVPVIATHTSGPAEIIQHKETGYLCDITASALADALEHAISNPAEANIWVAAAREEYKKYTLETVAPQLAECLKKIVSSAAA